MGNLNQTFDEKDKKPHNVLDDDAVAAQYLNTLLRGEIAAVNSYDLARKKFATDAAIKTIDKILFNHKSNVDFLKKKIFSKNETPSTNTGAWGLAVELIIKSTKFLGETPLIMALREGEDLGLKDYKYFLSSNVPENKSIHVIKNQIIPNTENNILLLNKLLKS